MERIRYSRILTEDLDWGTGERETRLQDGRVATLQQFDPGWEVAMRTGRLADYVGKGRATMISRPTAINAAITIPRDETLIIPPGGSLTLNAVVTCYGRIVADKNQIFTGPSTISFPEGGTVWAEWWGAKGDNSTDSAAAIRAALNANPIRMHVHLGEGTFLLGSAVTFPTDANINDVALFGMGQRTTILKRTAGYTGILLQVGESLNPIAPSRVFRLAGFTLDGIDSAVGTVGLRGFRMGESELEDCYVTRCEKGLWLSGGSHNIIRRCRIEVNTTGLIIDNNDAVAPTFNVVEDSWIRNNEVGAHVDGNAHATRLHRNTTFRHVAFENDPRTSGTDIGLKITQAQQVHVHECWFESNSRHVVVEGGDATQIAAFLTWHGCNFGTQNVNTPPGTPIVLWDGNGASDGIGSSITACRFGEEEFQFNSTYRVALRDNALFGNASLTGNSWYWMAANDTESQSYEELGTKTNWRVRRLQKHDGTTVHRHYEIFTTGTTTDATPTNIGEYSPPNLAGCIVTVRALARKSDSAEIAAYHVTGVFRTDAAGVVTALTTAANPSPQNEHDDIEDPTTFAGCDFTVNTAGGVGSTVRYRATGLAATTITWTLYVTVLQSHTP